jgi:hypothetical protein
MDILLNSTKLTEVENDALDSLEVAIWIIAGLAICAFLCCVWSFIDRIFSALSCLCKMLTCCCRSNGHELLSDDSD